MGMHYQIMRSLSLAPNSRSKLLMSSHICKRSLTQEGFSSQPPGSMIKSGMIRAPMNSSLLMITWNTDFGLYFILIADDHHFDTDFLDSNSFRELFLGELGYIYIHGRSHQLLDIKSITINVVHIASYLNLISTIDSKFIINITFLK
jgi:hypothetical protein